MRRASNSPPEECAVCGAEIPRSAKSCPECGADERTGWRDSDPYDGLDLPDEAWAEEPDQPPPRPGIRWYWLLTAALVLAALVWLVLGGS